MEYVVAKHQTCSVVANEIFANDERLCKTVGRRLLGILEPYAIVAAVAKQTLEAGQVLSCFLSTL